MCWRGRAANISLKNKYSKDFVMHIYCISWNTLTNGHNLVCFSLRKEPLTLEESNPSPKKEKVKNIAKNQWLKIDTHAWVPLVVTHVAAHITPFFFFFYFSLFS